MERSRCEFENVLTDLLGSDVTDPEVRPSLLLVIIQTPEL